MRAALLAISLCAPLISRGEEAPRALQIAEPIGKSKAATLEKVTSRSGQFRISGGDPLTRASIALLTEEAKEELLTLTEEKDLWAGKTPITLTLHGKQGDAMPYRTFSTSLTYGEAGYDLRLEMHLCRGIDLERLKSAITSCLIYERALRNATSIAQDQELIAPPWLVDGLREASEWKVNRADRALYAALFKQGGFFKIDELLSISNHEFEDIDAASRAAFRVSSGVLVMALLEQPRGKEAFRSFLSEVATFQGEMPTLLRKHFPELNLSETSLAKWSELQLANKGGLTPLTESLTISQTEASLSEALRLYFQTPEGIAQPKDLTAWPELIALKQPERLATVRPTQEAIARLSFRCFPSFRPILSEYQLVLAAATEPQPQDLTARLASLQESRATMLAKAQRARDFLDWFEITRARDTSGMFDDYMRLKDRLKANPIQRRDELSRYLDRMEKIFCRGLPAMPLPGPDRTVDPFGFPVSIDPPLPE